MKNPAKNPIWQIHPSAFLLAAQLLLLVVYAAFDHQYTERAWISIFGIIILVLRVWVVNRSPATDWVAWGLAVPGLALLVLTLFNDSSWVLVGSAFFEAALYFYTAASLIAYMMADYRVTTDELYAAGATFTLLAWGFAYSFQVCQILAPGSFINSQDARTSLSFIELLFLSVTNLSTAGLSDLYPVTATARALLILEQFAGVGYVAMVISRLVGLTTQRQKDAE